MDFLLKDGRLNHVESGFLQEDIGFYKSFHDSIWFHKGFNPWELPLCWWQISSLSLQVLTCWSRRLHRLQLGFGSGKISRVDGQIIADQLQDVPGKGQKLYKAGGTTKRWRCKKFATFWIVLVFSGICWYIFTGLRLVAYETRLLAQVRVVWIWNTVSNKAHSKWSHWWCSGKLMDSFENR